MSDDYTATTATTGTVAVGGSATGVIEDRKDIDWFAVTLEAGKTYVIDVEGDDTGGGTLGNAMLRGLYDSDGDLIAGTRDRNGGEGDNARLVFTATEDGTHYIAARGQKKEIGSYTVRVNEYVDADATAAGAFDMGDTTAPPWSGAYVQWRVMIEDTVDGGIDAVDYYRFTLREAQKVKLALYRQDADADLYLEDTDGTVLYSSANDGTAKESIHATLEAGTYYVRVAAQEAGENHYALRSITSATDDVAAARLNDAMTVEPDAM